MIINKRLNIKDKKCRSKLQNGSVFPDRIFDFYSLIFDLDDRREERWHELQG